MAAVCVGQSGESGESQRSGDDFSPRLTIPKTGTVAQAGEGGYGHCVVGGCDGQDTKEGVDVATLLRVREAAEPPRGWSGCSAAHGGDD